MNTRVSIAVIRIGDMLQKDVFEVGISLGESGHIHEISHNQEGWVLYSNEYIDYMQYTESGDLSPRIDELDVRGIILEIEKDPELPYEYTLSSGEVVILE